MKKAMCFLSAGLFIFATGCSSDKPANQPAGNAATENSDHSHGAGPHGGTIADLGGGAYHAEFTVDHDAKQSTVYILGSDGKTAAPINASKLLLAINEPSYEVELAAQPMPGETGGKSSRFVGQHDNLGIVREFAGTISVEADGTPYVGEFAEVAAGDHGHAHTPHDGVVAALKGDAGEDAGFVELKLHDDKGDLELWLSKDHEMTRPFDVPADTAITVSFKDHSGKTAALAVRNNEQNEGEDGIPNMRGGMTNYFIFPGDSGQDPTWLMGANFKSAVTVSFTANGKTYTSEDFVLVPHTHADGDAH
jgi:hypothetical protein